MQLGSLNQSRNFVPNFRRRQKVPKCESSKINKEGREEYEQNSATNFFPNVNLICYFSLQIFKLCSRFKVLWICSPFHTA